jgi:hypothetical protein
MTSQPHIALAQGEGVLVPDDAARARGRGRRALLLGGGTGLAGGAWLAASHATGVNAGTDAEDWTVFRTRFLAP